ncbi:MAG: hypothetical protein ACI8Y4_001530 [Candidatus Poriferisodalaceae bacterium]|jgi:hypothetical protein
MPDEIFVNPRLAEIYDAVDSDRSDLGYYRNMVHEFGATSVLDIGCGTGTFASTLEAIAGVVLPGGRLVFETRIPERRAWEQWTREQTFARHDIPGVGVVETWIELTDLSLPTVSFQLGGAGGSPRPGPARSTCSSPSTSDL